MDGFILYISLYPVVMKKMHLFIWIVILLNISLQLFSFRHYLNNEIVSSFQPSGSDAIDYVKKAEVLFYENNFTEAFKDGWRLPGYPFILYLCYCISGIVGVKPLLLIKIIQLIATAFIPYFLYKAQLQFTGNKRTSYIVLLLACIYIPFYYFTPQVLAESIALLLISILIWQLSYLANNKYNIQRVIIVAILISILVYLKPNLILLTIPVLFLISYKFKMFIRPNVLGFTYITYTVFIIVISLVPWLLFISNQNNRFIPLATTSGCDMVIGVGIPLNTLGSDQSSIVYDFEIKNNLPADIVFVSNKKGKTLAQQNSEYQKEALSIWKKRPWVTFKYGIIKILHGFGFSFRGIKDYLSLLVLLVSFLSLIIQLKNKENKYLSILYLSVIFIYSIQTIVYIPDMRMRIVLFDIPAILLIAVLINRFIPKNE